MVLRSSLAMNDNPSAEPERSNRVFDYGNDTYLSDTDPTERGFGMDGMMLALADAIDGRDYEADKNEWDDAHELDPSVKAEDLYSDTDEPSDRQAKRMKIFHREQGFDLLRIEDEEIYDAWKSGPEAVDMLRNRERRGILTVYGKPTKRPITEEDLETLYGKYEKLFAAPWHRTGECTECEDKSDGQFAPYTIFKKARWGDNESKETWHFTDPDSFLPIKRAYVKYKKACRGLDKQKQQIKDHEPIIAENKEREKQGKKPIPLNETKVDRFVRELDEGTRIPPRDEESKERAEKQKKGD